MSWEKEEISEKDFLYRHCHYLKRERISKKIKRHPNETSFILRDGEEALSFNWSKYADPERSYIVLGLTYSNSSENFIQYQDYTFFRYPYKHLSEIAGVSDISHDFLFIDNPSPVGKPNNRSHTAVSLDDDDLAIRVNLSDYVKDNYDECKCEVSLNDVQRVLTLLREKLNDTEYHKLWDFKNGISTLFDI